MDQQEHRFKDDQLSEILTAEEISRGLFLVAGSGMVLKRLKTSFASLTLKMTGSSMKISVCRIAAPSAVLLFLRKKLYTVVASCSQLYKKSKVVVSCIQL